MTKNNSDKPVFDIGSQNYGSLKDMSIAQAQAMRVQAVMMAMADDPKSVSFADIPRPDELKEIYNALDQHLCNVLVSVPQDWLVAGAPSDLDWAQVDSLDWVRSDRIGDLRDAMRLAADPEELSGN